MPGSMFENLLPNNISVYAMTASRADEEIHSDCGGDERGASFKWSSDWLYDSEHQDLTKETFATQYNYLAHTHTDAHPQQYGDKQVPINANSYLMPAQSENSVPIRDVPLYLAQRMIKSTNELGLKQRYVNELEVLLRNRELMNKQIEEYVNSLLGIEANVVLNSKLQINNRKCYHKLVDTFHNKCYILGQNTYAISKMQIFVNICEEMRELSDADINAVNQLLIQYCNKIVKPIEFIV
ncbi:unnamed protein product [Medioppia subpectinata]|uniref:Legumain prodomain domain-containing protein n=1 Tax=Medioppia subpectinata TaxID=1979941 RepID=A0A7R9Q1Z1_9ACAR|nr:unnamed protein product [Medioppia subpectinata]CAG2109748.1 unnamed protein product [Medioppia subpectinata]